jgi:hypothetical protein
MPVTYAIPSGYTALGGTWDAAHLGSGISLDGTSLIVTATLSSFNCARSTVQLAGKCYFEFFQSAGTNSSTGFAGGIGPSTMAVTGTGPGLSVGIGLFNASNGQLHTAGSTTSYAALYTIGFPSASIGIAVDISGKRLYFQKPSGTWYGSSAIAGGADPVAGTGGIDITAILSGTDYAFITVNTAGVTQGTGAFTGTSVAGAQARIMVLA